MDLSQYSLSNTEIEFLARKERAGDLVWSISSEFTGNADQITITPATGKTFYLVSAKLYPVTDTISMSVSNGVITTTNRRCDVELTFDSTVKDVLTYDFESITGTNTAGEFAQGSSSNSGQLVTNAKGISMVGNGSKTVKLTSTNTSGTYRVSILGYYEVS